MGPGNPASIIKRLFRQLNVSDNIRYGTLPTSADGAAALAITLPAAAVAWTFGAWTQIALAAVVLVDTQIEEATMENFVGAAGQGEIEIGTGVAPAGALLARAQISGPTIRFSNPIRIPAATGVVARYRTSTGVADTVDVKLRTKTGF